MIKKGIGKNFGQFLIVLETFYKTWIQLDELIGISRWLIDEQTFVVVFLKFRRVSWFV
jgi:hypothetical protein